jgi:clan AA aspartic protease
MIEGFVNEDLEPVIEIGLIAGDRVDRTFAIIDTGFNGYLCLAENLIDKMDLSYIGTDLFELGNGEIVENDVFSGRIIFDERECDVLAILSTSSDVLIGTSLLKAKTLFIDFIDRRVEVRDKEV